MVPVQQFGAVGNGHADDTNALRNALGQARGDLLFPRGVYRLTETVEVPLAECGPLSLRGAGGAVLRMEGPGPALRLVGTHAGTAAPASVQPGVYERERLPTLDGLEIVGAHPQADGVRIEGTFKAILTRLFIRECRHAVHLTSRNRDVIISDCQLYHNRGCGVILEDVNLHQINVLGSHLSYNAGGGIKVLNSEVRNLQITGNDIEYNYDLEAEQSADIWLETGERSIREGTIASNTIQAKPSPGGANIRFVGQSAETAHKVGLFSIVGNLISNQEVNLHLKWARGVVVSGNTLYSGHRRSVIAEESSKLVFSGNLWDHNPDYPGDTPDGLTFRHCRAVTLTGLHLDRARGEGEDGAAVLLDRCEDVLLRGGQILDASPHGMTLLDCRHCRIEGVHIRDRREPPQMRAPALLRRGGENILRLDGSEAAGPAPPTGPD